MLHQANSFDKNPLEKLTFSPQNDPSYWQKLITKLSIFSILSQLDEGNIFIGEKLSKKEDKHEHCNEQ